MRIGPWVLLDDEHDDGKTLYDLDAQRVVRAWVLEFLERDEVTNLAEDWALPQEHGSYVPLLGVFTCDHETWFASTLDGLSLRRLMSEGACVDASIVGRICLDLLDGYAQLSARATTTGLASRSTICRDGRTFVTFSPRNPQRHVTNVMPDLSDISPNQARGRRLEAEDRVFNVGMVGYQLLAGRKAIDADNSIQRLRAIVDRDFVPLDRPHPFEDMLQGRLVAQAYDELASLPVATHDEVAGFLATLFAERFAARDALVEEILAASPPVDRPLLPF